MASNVPDLGGYDCKFVSEPPDFYICLICTFVAKDAQQMDCCGKVYCRLCLTEHMKRSKKCPQCRKEGNSFNDKRGIMACIILFQSIPRCDKICKMS